MAPPGVFARGGGSRRYGFGNDNGGGRFGGGGGSGRCVLRVRVLKCTTGGNLPRTKATARRAKPSGAGIENGLATRPAWLHSPQRTIARRCRDRESVSVGGKVPQAVVATTATATVRPECSGTRACVAPAPAHAPTAARLAPRLHWSTHDGRHTPRCPQGHLMAPARKRPFGYSGDVHCDLCARGALQQPYWRIGDLTIVGDGAPFWHCAACSFDYCGCAESRDQ